MNIHIPSCGRATVEQQSTAFAFARAGIQVRLVVPTNELSEYKRGIKNTFVSFVACPAKGISKTRQWIVEQSPRNLVVMMDDDLRFYHRPNMSSAALVECDATSLRSMLTRIQRLSNSYAMVGMSARQGNNHVTEPTVVATRAMNVYAFDKRILIGEGIEFGRTPLMEDFDVTLQLLKTGYSNAVIYDYCWNQRGSNAAGGCSTYRDASLQSRAATTLAKLHPGLVTVIQKKAKATWNGMETRTDVRIAWKKALSGAQP